MMNDDAFLTVPSVHHVDASLDSLERHLKRAPGKSGQSSIRNVDFIYMINLDARPEKYALARRYLEAYGIKPYRFSAVDGWKLSKTALQDVGVKFRPGMTPLLATTYPSEVDAMIQSHELMTEGDKTYFVHCMPLGAIGCSLSHISVLQDAYDSGYQTIWVLEDDIEVLADPHALSDLISELDAVVGADCWDVLFTDVDYRVRPGEYLPAFGAAKRPDFDCRQEVRFGEKYTCTAEVNDHFRRIGARFGSTSMVIRRSGIVRLLDFFKTRHIFLPHDLDNHLPEGIKRYALTFDLVTNMLHSLSDIGVSGAPGQSLPVERFVEKYSEPIDQDLVVGRATHRVGTDVCDSRYELIRPVLDLYADRFSVLDVGAAQGYFSFRIAQDYPSSSCLMLEADDAASSARHGSMLSDLCDMNRLPNVRHMSQRVTLSGLTAMAATDHFDIVLAMGGVHLVDSRLSEQIRILDALLALGDHVILEMLNDVAVPHIAYVDDLAESRGARCLGEAKRHKDPASAATGRLFWFTKRSDHEIASATHRSPEHDDGR